MTHQTESDTVALARVGRAWYTLPMPNQHTKQPRRTRVIRVRLTEVEYAGLVSEAERRGLTVSDTIRARLKFPKESETP